MAKLYLAHCALNGCTGHDAGRQLLGQLFEAHVGGEMPEISVAEGGKPYFAAENWHFSISHTKKHAFCALSDSPVGIDAEETDRKIDLRLADKILSPAEKARFDAAENKHQSLLRLWVLKEAYAKLTGRGIGNWLKNTDFNPEDPRITCIDGCFVAVLEGEI